MDVFQLLRIVDQANLRNLAAILRFRPKVAAGRCPPWSGRAQDVLDAPVVPTAGPRAVRAVAAPRKAMSGYCCHGNGCARDTSFGTQAVPFHPTDTIRRRGIGGRTPQASLGSVRLPWDSTSPYENGGTHRVRPEVPRTVTVKSVAILSSIPSLLSGGR